MQDAPTVLEIFHSLFAVPCWDHYNEDKIFTSFDNFGLIDLKILQRNMGTKARDSEGFSWLYRPGLAFFHIL